MRAQQHPYAHASTSPDHDLLALAGEAGGKELREVLLDEAEHQHMAQGGDGDDEDDDKRDEGQQVPGCALQCRHLTGLQSAACTREQLGVSWSGLHAHSWCEAQQGRNAQLT